MGQYISGSMVEKSFSTLLGCGPATREGKEIVKYNASKSGLWDKRIVIRALGESQEEFERLREAMRRDLNPIGQVEEDLVEQLIELSWKKKRSWRAESAYVVEQLIEVERSFTQQLHSLGEERQNLVQSMSRLEEAIKSIELAAVQEPTVWTELDKLSWDFMLDWIVPRCDKKVQEELHNSTTPEQLRDILKQKVGWDDAAIVGGLQKVYGELLVASGEKLRNLDEQIEQARQAFEIAKEKACIPTPEVVEKIERHLGPMEKRYVKTLELLVKLQAIRLGFKRLNDNNGKEN